MKKLFWWGLVGLVFSVHAIAKDDPVVIDGKSIVITDF
jgi:hypothetical protein